MVLKSFQWEFFTGIFVAADKCLMMRWLVINYIFNSWLITNFLIYVTSYSVDTIKVNIAECKVSIN